MTSPAAPDDGAVFDDGASADDVVARLDERLGVLARRSHTSTARLAARIHPDLDASAYPLVLHIAQTPGVRPSEVADHFSIGRGTASRQITRLVELGLVHRATDPDDCRGQVLSLTDAGRASLRAARERRRAWFHEVLGDWDEGDLQTFARLIDRFVESVDRP